MTGSTPLEENSQTCEREDDLAQLVLATDRYLLASLINNLLSAHDTPELLKLLNREARSVGMSSISKKSGVAREALYKALRPTSKIQLRTFLGVLHALGMTVRLEAISEEKPDN